MTLKSIFESIINFDLTILFKITVLIIIIWIGYFLLNKLIDWIHPLIKKVKSNGFKSLSTKEKLILVFGTLYLIYFIVSIVYF